MPNWLENWGNNCSGFLTTVRGYRGSSRGATRGGVRKSTMALMAHGEHTFPLDFIMKPAGWAGSKFDI